MDSLSVYFNAIWQEAQRPLPKVERPNTSADLIAFVSFWLCCDSLIMRPAEPGNATDRATRLPL